MAKAQSIKDTLRLEIQRKGRSYGAVARELGVSKGALWKYLNTDYEPRDPQIRRRLGLTVEGREIILQAIRRDGRGRFSQ